MSNVPAAVDMQPFAIMDPIGMVIVNVPDLPFIVPLTIMTLPQPARRIVPENVEPFWVSCHVVDPEVAPDSPDPIIDPLESDAAPTQLPVIVAMELGLEMLDDCEHAMAEAPTNVNKTRIRRFITPPRGAAPLPMQVAGAGDRQRRLDRLKGPSQPSVSFDSDRSQRRIFAGDAERR